MKSLFKWLRVQILENNNKKPHSSSAKSKSFERVLLDGELVVKYKIRDIKSIMKIIFHVWPLCPYFSTISASE